MSNYSLRHECTNNLINRQLRYVLDINGFHANFSLSKFEEHVTKEVLSSHYREERHLFFNHYHARRIELMNRMIIRSRNVLYLMYPTA
jgi:uncharacterized protein YehS (DUF1456 family)